MKKLCTLILLALSVYAQAQIGIGTTSPNSTLDVRGALSLTLRVFTGTTTAVSGTDNTLVFTGTAASTATLPDATTCSGRMYRIKNASTTSPTPALTIATTSSQTIDGISSWVIDEGYGSVTVVSNGTNWLISSQSVPKSSGSAWLQGGNTVTGIKKLGTISNYDLPFITNNTEKMRLTASGSLGVGTTTFNATYPERLLADAGATGNTNYQNVIVGKGNTNSYAQLNIQNSSTGTAASSDVVATANNGDESTNFIDLGINGGGNTSTGALGGANTAYLYSTGNDFAIGNGSNSKNLNFFTTTSSTYTERMRITSAGNVGIGNSAPSEKLDVTGNIAFSGALMPDGSAGSVGTFLISTGSNSSPTWFDASGYAWIVNGNSVPSVKYFGTTSNYDLPFITNNTEQMRITNTGNVGIGTSTFNSSYPEQLLVNAGTPGTITDYQNVIVGKGHANSYAQLNIQNTYSSANNNASSDVVATSDNGNETANFIDMGINSGTNSTSGVIGGANTAYLYSTGTNFAIGNGTNSKDIVFFTTTSGTYTERMRLLNAGTLVPGATNTYDLGSTGLRWKTIYSNNVLNTSDARLKTNIKSLNYGLSAVLNLRPVEYNWKEGVDKDKKIGFLAQELRTVIPEVVVGDESKETLAVNYTELIPVLVNAIKEQQKQIEDLKKRIDVLEKK